MITILTKVEMPEIVGAFVSSQPFTVHYVYPEIPEKVRILHAKGLPSRTSRGAFHAMFLTAAGEIVALAGAGAWESIPVNSSTLILSPETADLVDWFDCPEEVQKQFPGLADLAAGVAKKITKKERKNA